MHIIVSRASAAAIAAVEKAGGTVTTRYYTPFSVQKIRQGLMDPIHSMESRIQVAGEAEPPKPEDLVYTKNGYKYRLPDPLSRKALEYYRDEAHRGYLSYTVEEGQGPSLFFKTPEERPKKFTKKRSGGVEQNRLW
jgi:large subunit ribosomal protein L15